MQQSIIQGIIQIFQSVLKRDFCTEKELNNASVQFLECKLEQLQLKSKIPSKSQISFEPDNIPKIAHPLKESQDEGQPHDYFGEFFKQKLSSSDKKTQGIVYTPRVIARKMVVDGLKFMNQVKGTAITYLDPCCGTGIFLQEILWYLYLENSPERRIGDTLPSLLKQIIGLDRDPIACLCSTLNIFLCIVKLAPAFVVDLCREPGLIQIIPQDYLSDQIPDQIRDKDPLFIIGNPPYVFLRNLPLSEKDRLRGHFSSSTKQFDTYGLFFERSLQILPSNGVVCLVIPDSILTLQNRHKTRELLLQSSHILKIWRVGDIFPGISVASVVIIARKLPFRVDKSQLATQIEDNMQGENIPVKEVQQSTFIEAGHTFAPAFTTSSHAIAHLLQQSAMSISDFNYERKASEQLRIARGIEIGKNGNVMECPRCQVFYPQPAKPAPCPTCEGILKPHDSIFFTTNNVPPSFAGMEKKPIVQTLQRWRCGPVNLVAWDLRGIKYKDVAIYSDRRVIIRQLLQNGLLCAALPPTGALTTQSVYNLNLPLSFDPLEMLGILNSDVIAAVAYELFSSGKKLFPRILLHVMKDLPLIPRISPPEPIKHSLKHLTEHFLANPALDKDELARNQLNSLVLNYLGCPTEAQYVILHAVQKFIEATQPHGRP